MKAKSLPTDHWKWRLSKGTMQVTRKQNENAEGGKVQTWRGGEGLAKMCYEKAIWKPMILYTKFKK